MAFAPPADVASALEDEATGVATSDPATVRAIHSAIAESLLATNSIAEAEYDEEHEVSHAPDWFGPALAAVLAAGLAPVHGQLVNVNARQVNSVASDNTDTLETLTNGAGAGPGGALGFPATLGELHILTGQQLSASLTFYGRPASGTVDEKRRRFKKHVGIRP